MLISRNLITCLCNETLSCVPGHFLPFSYSLLISLLLSEYSSSWMAPAPLHSIEAPRSTPDNLLRLGLCLV